MKKIVEMLSKKNHIYLNTSKIFEYLNIKNIDINRNTRVDNINSQYIAV